MFSYHVGIYGNSVILVYIVIVDYSFVKRKKQFFLFTLVSFLQVQIPLLIFKLSNTSSHGLFRISHCITNYFPVTSITGKSVASNWVACLIKKTA
jgi:hypothetical protein